MKRSRRHAGLANGLRPRSPSRSRQGEGADVGVVERRFRAAVDNHPGEQDVERRAHVLQPDLGTLAQDDRAGGGVFAERLNGCGVVDLGGPQQVVLIAEGHFGGLVGVAVVGRGGLAVDGQGGGDGVYRGEGVHVEYPFRVLGMIQLAEPGESLGVLFGLSRSLIKRSKGVFDPPAMLRTHRV